MWIKNKNIKIKYVGNGQQYVSIIDIKGNLYCFGSDEYIVIHDGYSHHHPDEFECISIPQKINFNKFINNNNDNDIIYIKHVSCGRHHIMLLTENKNNIIGWGDNKWNQIYSNDCVKLLNKPYLISKNKDLGIKQNMYIETIIAMDCETMFIINPYKTVK